MPLHTLVDKRVLRMPDLLRRQLQYEPEHYGNPFIGIEAIRREHQIVCFGHPGGLSGTGMPVEINHGQRPLRRSQPFRVELPRAAREHDAGVVAPKLASRLGVTLADLPDIPRQAVRFDAAGIV